MMSFCNRFAGKGKSKPEGEITRGTFCLGMRRLCFVSCLGKHRVIPKLPVLFSFLHLFLYMFCLPVFAMCWLVYNAACLNLLSNQIFRDFILKLPVLGLCPWPCLKVCFVCGIFGRVRLEFSGHLKGGLTI